MGETRFNPLQKILAFAAIVEVGTGLVLMIDPALVVALLLGVSVAADEIPIGRVAGIAMLSLGLACWPNRQGAQSGLAALRAMLAYNMLVALYLAYLGTVGSLGGLLLWPAVALHAVVALLLIWTSRHDRLAKN